MTAKHKSIFIVHVIYRMALGGLEKGLIRLIRRTMPLGYRHAVICLADITELAKELPPEVEIYALNKQAGIDLQTKLRVFRLLRKLRPEIIHTRNLGALDVQPLAWLAGIPIRIHGEHGRDIYDLDGSSRKYNMLRKVLRPTIHHYTAVSRDLADWLAEAIGLPPEDITIIHNAVDASQFQPREGLRADVGPKGFTEGPTFVIGAVGRMQIVKDHPTLIRAFLRILEREPQLREHIRLMVVGDGPLRQSCLEMVERGDLSDSVWIPGERLDIPELMRAMDLFVLPSLAEGMCNTVLEAMATGLPVVATRIGGNPELVEHGVTGMLTPASNPEALAEAMLFYIKNRQVALEHGRAGRRKVDGRFTIDRMVDGYVSVYEKLLNEHAASERAELEREGERS